MGVLWLSPSAACRRSTSPWLDSCRTSDFLSPACVCRWNLLGLILFLFLLTDWYAWDWIFTSLVWFLSPLRSCTCRSLNNLYFFVYIVGFFGCLILSPPRIFGLIFGFVCLLWKLISPGCITTSGAGGLLAPGLVFRHWSSVFYLFSFFPFIEMSLFSYWKLDWRAFAIFRVSPVLNLAWDRRNIRWFTPGHLSLFIWWFSPSIFGGIDWLFFLRFFWTTSFDILVFNV